MDGMTDDSTDFFSHLVLYPWKTIKFVRGNILFITVETISSRM